MFGRGPAENLVSRPKRRGHTTEFISQIGTQVLKISIFVIEIY